MVLPLMRHEKCLASGSLSSYNNDDHALSRDKSDGVPACPAAVTDHCEVFHPACGSTTQPSRRGKYDYDESDHRSTRSARLRQIHQASTSTCFLQRPSPRDHSTIIGNNFSWKKVTTPTGNNNMKLTNGSQGSTKDDFLSSKFRSRILEAEVRLRELQNLELTPPNVLQTALFLDLFKRTMKALPDSYHHLLEEVCANLESAIYCAEQKHSDMTNNDRILMKTTPYLDLDKKQPYFLVAERQKRLIGSLSDELQHQTMLANSVCKLKKRCLKLSGEMQENSFRFVLHTLFGFWRYRVQSKRKYVAQLSRRIERFNWENLLPKPFLHWKMNIYKRKMTELHDVKDGMQGELDLLANDITLLEISKDTALKDLEQSRVEYRSLSHEKQAERAYRKFLQSSLLTAQPEYLKVQILGAMEDSLNHIVKICRFSSLEVRRRLNLLFFSSMSRGGQSKGDNFFNHGTTSNKKMALPATSGTSTTPLSSNGKAEADINNVACSSVSVSWSSLLLKGILNGAEKTHHKLFSILSRWINFQLFDAKQAAISVLEDKGFWLEVKTHLPTLPQYENLRARCRALANIKLLSSTSSMQEKEQMLLFQKTTSERKHVSTMDNSSNNQASHSTQCSSSPSCSSNHAQHAKTPSSPRGAADSTISKKDLTKAYWDEVFLAVPEGCNPLPHLIAENFQGLLMLFLTLKTKQKWRRQTTMKSIVPEIKDILIKCQSNYKSDEPPSHFHFCGSHVVEEEELHQAGDERLKKNNSETDYADNNMKKNKSKGGGVRFHLDDHESGNGISEETKNTTGSNTLFTKKSSINNSVKKKEQQSEHSRSYNSPSSTSTSSNPSIIALNSTGNKVSVC